MKQKFNGMKLFPTEGKPFTVGVDDGVITIQKDFLTIMLTKEDLKGIDQAIKQLELINSPQNK